MKKTKVNAFKKRFQPVQKGFTLIELVCVIALIGVLASIAISKYQALGTKASSGKLDTMMSAISIGSYNNRLAAKAGSTTAIPIDGTRAAMCTNSVLNSVMGTPLPSNIVVGVVGGITPDCSGGGVFIYCSLSEVTPDGTSFGTGFTKLYCNA